MQKQFNQFIIVIPLNQRAFDFIKSITLSGRGLPPREMLSHIVVRFSIQ